MPVPKDEALRALEEELFSLIRRSRMTTRELARIVHPRLDPSSYPLVAVLAAGPPRRVSDLANQLGLDKSTASRQIDAAVRLGLVERIPDPSDARARLVSLTESGKATVTTQLKERRRLLLSRLGSWDETDLVELARLLRKLRESGTFRTDGDS